MNITLFLLRANTIRASRDYLPDLLKTVQKRHHWYLERKPPQRISEIVLYDNRIPYSPAKCIDPTSWRGNRELDNILIIHPMDKKIKNPDAVGLGKLRWKNKTTEEKKKHAAMLVESRKKK